MGFIGYLDLSPFRDHFLMLSIEVMRLRLALISFIITRLLSLTSPDIVKEVVEPIQRDIVIPLSSYLDNTDPVRAEAELKNSTIMSDLSRVCDELTQVYVSVLKQSSP